MFIPFVYSIAPNDNFLYKSILSKFIWFANKFGYSVMAQENYWEHMDNLTSEELSLLATNTAYWLGGKYELSKTDIEKADRISIPLSLDNKIIAKYPNQAEAYASVIKENDEDLQLFFEELIDNLTSKNEKIEGFICFNFPKSLEIVAKKNNIPIINTEGSSFRSPFYRVWCHRFDRNVYSPDFFNKNLEIFTNENKSVPKLTRKGIMRLFSEGYNQKYIHLIDETPIFEFGVFLKPTDNILVNCYAPEDYYSIVNNIRKEDVIFRDRNDSENILQYIAKCKRLVSSLSSSTFDTILAGRISHCYGNHAFTTILNNAIDDTSKDKISIDVINFIVFFYYIPTNWLFNPEYLRYRISNPSPSDVYQKTFEYWAKNISNEELKIYYQTENRAYKLGNILYFLSDVNFHNHASYYFKSEFSEQELSYISSKGDFSEFEFDIYDDVVSDLDVNIELFNISSKLITVFVNGIKISDFNIDSDTLFLNFVIPFEIAKNKKLLIRLDFGEFWGDFAVSFRSVVLSKTTTNNFFPHFVYANAVKKQFDKEKGIILLQVDALSKQLEIMTQKYNAVLNSTSWKITRPFRVIIRKIKSLLNKYE